jgi:hypothetical protein
MDKPETQAVLRKETAWTNQRCSQYWNKTQNGQTRTRPVLRQDTAWTNQRHMLYWDKTDNGQTRDTGSIATRHRIEINKAKNPTQKTGETNNTNNINPPPKHMRSGINTDVCEGQAISVSNRTHVVLLIVKSDKSIESMIVERRLH